MTQPPAPPESKSPLRTVVESGVGLAVFVALLFLPAGRLDWPAGWLYFGLLQVGWWTNYALVARRNPDLLRRREKEGEGTPDWDRRVQHPIRLSVLAVFVVAGLDAVRYGWSAAPPWLWVAGAALHVGGYALLTWSMVVNAHFEGSVRLQKELGHRVCDRGPYRIVRHPGYVGFSFLMLAIPAVLGSLWAFAPAVLGVGFLAARTAMEDRFLLANLDGYTDFARRVRHRLVPGLW